MPSNFLSGKSCLVIGGGPSSFHLNDEIYDSYDVVIVCNHFFKNEYLKSKKANIVLLGDEDDMKEMVNAVLKVKENVDEIKNYKL